MTVRLLVIVQTWWDVTIISRTPGNLHISYLGCATFNDLELKGRLVKRLIITSCAGVFRPNEPLQQLREHHRLVLELRLESTRFLAEEQQHLQRGIVHLQQVCRVCFPLPIGAVSWQLNVVWGNMTETQGQFSDCFSMWFVLAYMCHVMSLEPDQHSIFEGRYWS